MKILQLFVWSVCAAIAGLAAGIVFVFACSATVGDGMTPGAPAWVVGLADLWWLPPLVGIVLGATLAIVLWRRKQKRGGPQTPPGPQDAV